MTESVAIMSAVDPYPVDAGKKVVLAGFLEYFSARYGAENVHYLLVGSRPDGDFPVQLHELPKPRHVEALGNVLTRTMTGRSSLQESMLRSEQTRRAATAVIDRIEPSLEIYDTIRMAQYAPEGGTGTQICYLDDLFSERYGAILAAKQSGVTLNVLGNFAEHLPRRLRFIAENRRAQRGLLHTERMLVRSSENRTALAFSRSLLVNEEEVAVLRGRSGLAADRVASLPPLISAPRYVPRQFDGSADFVFLGLLSLPHNDDGLRSFLDSVWPLVLRARPDARLHVVGRDVLPDLEASIARYSDSVTLEGFVPDLSDLFSRTAALINPLRFGSGIKLKVIEALGRGVPVVSTACGASGIASGPDHGVLVADDPALLAEHLCAAAEVADNAALSEAARVHFEESYSTEAVYRQYDKAFGVGPEQRFFANNGPDLVDRFGSIDELRARPA